RLVERRFDLLGYEGLDFGKEIDWSLDPVHGKRAPDLPWPQVPFMNFDRVGDHKVIWELNRHQFLITLAKAYRLTGDERFAKELAALWYDWQRKNPYPAGINWASALEVAFRAQSWMWADFLLAGTPAASGRFRGDISREVARAGWYIERYLSTYFAPNTHLLGEAAVLLLAGARYPALPAAARWRDKGWGILLEEAKRQVRPDGMHFEQSTYYHVYALDCFLHSRRIAERNGIRIPPEFEDAIERMLGALAALGRGGVLPRFGDDDGGRWFDGSRNGSECMLDPLALTEEALWLNGRTAAERADFRRPAGAVALRDSGIYAMASTDGRCQLFIDAGEQGSLASGHGHADALSIQLSIDGKLWLTDPGTFCYVGKDRNRFRGTAAHNTLMVDGVDQAEPRGPFGWGPRPMVETLRWSEDEFEGRHSGYQRLRDPVTHRRSVARAGSDGWLVRDFAEGQGTHALDISWHFEPGIELVAEGNGVVARRSNDKVILKRAEGSHWDIRIEEYDYSPVYGRRAAARRVRWSNRLPCPAEFAVVIERVK
ncbi:MAG TPA: alginate lyase family protein, partial [Bryobacteraceae bacterium]|nr:alginate lyase family protein [Bryobacteraceae bacterium]